jgi:dTDP-4-amino-4,6-dideoxygalactose transaminase
MKDAGRPAGSSRRIAFNQPTLRGRERAYVNDALAGDHLGANGPYTGRVEERLAAYLDAPRVLLTHSCTAALEIAALLTVGPGDEVILPSFTYATTASAFVRAGATPIFADVSAHTFNLDPGATQAAVTDKTRAIVGVHYAGVSCDVDALMRIAQAAGAAFIEDAAHAFGARCGNRALGTLGCLGALSFHETKNVVSGEGGALVINDPALIARAEALRDRGTNRAQFLRKEVDEYAWVDLGSAFAPPEIVAAFLLAQVEDVEAITAQRLRVWRRYDDAFAALAAGGLVRRPCIPPEAVHNGHIYHLLLADHAQRSALLALLDDMGIQAAFHYVPLHGTPAGQTFGRAGGPLTVTEDVAGRLLRLPLHAAMSDRDQDEVIAAVIRAVAH